MASILTIVGMCDQAWTLIQIGDVFAIAPDTREFHGIQLQKKLVRKNCVATDLSPFYGLSSWHLEMVISNLNSENHPRLQQTRVMVVKDVFICL